MSHTKISITKTISLLASLLLCFMSNLACSAEAIKVGFVNTARILQESNAMKDARKRLEQEFSPRDRELQEMKRRLKALTDKYAADMSSNMSDSERTRRQREISDLDRDTQRKNREYLEDLNHRKGELLEHLNELKNKAIRTVATTQNYDLVLEDAVYASKRIDITDKVLKALNAN